MYEIIFVKSDDFAEIEHWVYPLLKKGERYGEGKFLAEDLIQYYKDGDMQLWIAFDGKGIHAACITQITRYPRKKMLTIVSLAGKRFEKWQHIVQILKEYAYQYDCDGLEFYGRKGWLKKAVELGFKPCHYVFGLTIKDDQDAEHAKQLC